MRLFVGIEAGATIANAAATLIAHLQKTAAALAPRAKIAWIPPERLHLTVRFIGQVDQDRYRAIARAFEPRMTAGAFLLGIKGIGSFPPSGSPRVLWAGVSEGLHALEAVEQEVARRLESTGIPAEERPYRPHLTLARVREAAGLKAAALLDAVRDRELGAARVEAITLFESRLSPKGPTYVALQQTPLHR